MKKKLFKVLMAIFVVGSIVSCNKEEKSKYSSESSQETSSSLSENKSEIETMSKSKQEFYNYINNLESFPASFQYGDTGYHGFNLKHFQLIEHKIEKDQIKEAHNIILTLKNELMITISANYYEGYDAFDWILYFTNYRTNDTKVISRINAIDYTLNGQNPLLKGNYGDHDKVYTAYEKDLTKEAIHMSNDIGRATHITFPYFNLETDQGGVLLALGWAGTWQSDFTFNKENNSTNITGNGNYKLKTYLKSGETIRTALVGMVRYYEKDEYEATNKWRRWYLDCNAPSLNKKGDKFTPQIGVMLKRDLDCPTITDAVNEDYSTWKRSLKSIEEHGLKYNFRWIDAGWYQSPDGHTVVNYESWWDNVGSWVLDKNKWPEETLKESVQYAKDNANALTMLWFETERITHLDDLINTYNFKREWALTSGGPYEPTLINLGDENAYQWIKKRVFDVITENNITIYREDFNMEPNSAWETHDVYLGKNRQGITENLYIQNHYRLWDEVRELTASLGGAYWVDSCASGGGRNDLESMRRGYPVLRSDSEWAMVTQNASLRLAYTHALSKWLPINGLTINEYKNNQVSKYFARCSYNPIMSYSLGFSKNKNLDWDVVLQTQKEFEEISKYLIKDYYPLTPYHKTTDNKNIEVFEFFDSELNEGVIEAYRQDNCEYNKVQVCLQGLDKDKYYSLEDKDGNLSMTKVKGAMLQKGFNIILNEKASSAIIVIKEAK